MSRITQNIKTLLGTASIMGVPVIVSEQSTYLLGSVIEEVIDCLPENTTYLKKTSFS